MNKDRLALANEWLAKGDHDIGNAEILYREYGYTDTIAFLIQQTVEKYLKGYLIAHGWKLRRIHDLEELLNEAIALVPFQGQNDVSCHSEPERSAAERRRRISTSAVETDWIASGDSSLPAVAQNDICQNHLEKVLDESFAEHLDACQKITEYYIEARYPLALPVEYSRDEIAQSLAETREIITKIRREFAKEGDAE